jgi:hypothetical protein
VDLNIIQDWRIKTNSKDEWTLISAFAGFDIASFKTKKELLHFLAQQQIYEGRKKAVEMLMTYPNRWIINGNKIIADNYDDVYEKYFYWVNSINSKASFPEYYKAIDDKLAELMKR